MKTKPRVFESGETKAGNIEQKLRSGTYERQSSELTNMYECTNFYNIGTSIPVGHDHCPRPHPSIQHPSHPVPPVESHLHKPASQGLITGAAAVFQDLTCAPSLIGFA